MQAPPSLLKRLEPAYYVFITLAIVGIIYGSIVAAVQPDAKKLVAYSSVAHLGFVILGIFTFTRIGLMGAQYPRSSSTVTCARKLSHTWFVVIPWLTTSA